MKRLVLLVLVCLISTSVIAQHQHGLPTNTKPATLIPGLGSHHHPVTTSNPDAQRFFDQGLTLIYAFNHEEARRSFQRALELDPAMAMAHWGIALALGPNINLDVDAEREKLAYDAIQKARLASNVTEAERDFIAALAKRYSNDPKADLKKLAQEYKQAMGELMKKYPDDLDAATLYADAAMNLRPWKYWTNDGKPAEGTEEFVAVLESVLKRNPDHIGANHLYIHAVEASRHPEWALPSANRLKVLAPAAGHLVHMPAHIDMRTGNYEAAARANAYGAVADEEYFKVHGQNGMYPLMYYAHNLHFLANAHAMQGRSVDAKRAAERLQVFLLPYLQEGKLPAEMLPMMEMFAPMAIMLRVRFHQWDDILQSAAPDKKLLATTALWHFARGMAHAANGLPDKAETELQALLNVSRSIPPDGTLGLNSAHTILRLANHVLSARVAEVRKQDNTVIELLKQAVTLEDELAYNEPPDWILPVREMLGGALLRKGDYAVAEEVFRADLEKNPRSGRSLFGLLESLKAQKKTTAAQLVEREFKTAWKNADVQLRREDL